MSNLSGILIQCTLLHLLLLSVFAANSNYICPTNQIYSPTNNDCVSCHFSCDTCSGINYYQCTKCQPGRGIFANNTPVAGMCECPQGTQDNDSGECASPIYSQQYISGFTIMLTLALLFSLVSVLGKGMRFFLYKIIEDFQQMSILALFHMYLTHQLTYFLKNLYSFNFIAGPKIFEVMASGSGLIKYSSEQIVQLQGQNLDGRFRLMGKTVNFFANSFNVWLLFGLCALFMWVIRVIRRRNSEDKDSRVYRYVNKLYNITHYGLLITIGQMVLVDLNLNIGIQMGNVTAFSTGFSVFGTIFSAVALMLQACALYFLLRKFQDQAQLKEQYRNGAYSSCWYFLRIDRKLTSKYYFFAVCAKKIMLGLTAGLLYYRPVTMALTLLIQQIVWGIFVVYSEPFERKYLRIYAYLCQLMKCLVFLNFTGVATKYRSSIPQTDLTTLILTNLTILVGVHLVFTLMHIFIEHKVYWLFCSNRCKNEETSTTDHRFMATIEGKPKIYHSDFTL